MGKAQGNGRVRALIVTVETKRGWDGPEWNLNTSSVTCKVDAVDVLPEDGISPCVVPYDVKNITERTTDSPYDYGTGLRTAGLEDADLADYQVQVRASLDKYHEDRPQFHGWADYYSPYTVNLDRAERMLKALRKIERGLEKVRVYGDWYAVTPGEHVARHARLLGVGTILVIEQHGGGWNHDSVRYGALTLEQAVEHINDLHRQWVSHVAPQHLATVAS